MRYIKKIMPIFIIILFLIIIAFIVLNNKSINYETENYSIDELYSKIDIINRSKILKENQIFIGNNDKELENDFYDLKVYINDGINYDIQKLWIDISENTLINNKYLKDIIENTNIYNFTTETQKTIYDFIIETYTEYLSNNIIDKTIIVKDGNITYILKADINKNIYHLKISRGG